MWENDAYVWVRSLTVDAAMLCQGMPSLSPQPAVAGQICGTCVGGKGSHHDRGTKQCGVGAVAVDWGVNSDFPIFKKYGVMNSGLLDSRRYNKTLFDSLATIKVQSALTPPTRVCIPIAGTTHVHLNQNPPGHRSFRRNSSCAAEKEERSKARWN